MPHKQTMQTYAGLLPAITLTQAHSAWSYYRLPVQAAPSWLGMEKLAEDIPSFVPTHVCGFVTLLGIAAPAFLTVQTQSQPGLSWVISSHTVWLLVAHIQLLIPLQCFFVCLFYMKYALQIYG